MFGKMPQIYRISYGKTKLTNSVYIVSVFLVALNPYLEMTFRRNFELRLFCKNLASCFRLSSTISGTPKCYIAGFL